MRKWSFIDDIHFINMQLDYYYGTDSWPRRYCSDIVGISDSTHRKYSKQNWNLNKEEEAYVNSLIDYSEHEIKKITFEDTYKFYASANGPIKRNFPKNNQLITPKKEKLNITHKPDYEYTIPEKSGLYLLAQITSPANDPGIQYYAVKVGQSINLKDRMSSYKSTNPFASIIDIKEIKSNQIKLNIIGKDKNYIKQISEHNKIQKQLLKENLDAEEKYCHNFLSKIGGESQKGTEWYVIPKEEYKKLISLGFKYIYK